ncbi:MAG: peptidoglycan DD-metalloendopeptidase family protein [Azospirillum sp.]|nr:peptidoglycan DD-metalloendopeptidase family protein [Azospirillum sp.]
MAVARPDLSPAVAGLTINTQPGESPPSAAQTAETQPADVLPADVLPADVLPADVQLSPGDGGTEPAAPNDEWHLSLDAGRGDTLFDLLLDNQVARAEADAAIQALRPVFDPRKLRIGQSIDLTFQRRDGAVHLGHLALSPDPVHHVRLDAQVDTGFRVSQETKSVERHLAAAHAVIASSQYEAGVKAGVPIPILLSVIKVYSHDVDFQRDFQEGDRFEVLYERFVTGDGVAVRTGDLLFARLVLSGRDLPIYRFQTADGRVDYYDREGQSVRRALLRTPLDGARITSGFGQRRHPILGYSKMHQGVDFGAPSGTPIYAAGAGMIEEARRRNGYGNYLRIRHNTEIATAYAHLSRFGSGARRGARVDQGDLIGYVGATGRATGPHLHYEVLRAGRQVNPLSVDTPVGRRLKGRELNEFQQAVASADRAFQAALGNDQVADLPATCTQPGRC